MGLNTFKNHILVSIPVSLTMENIGVEWQHHGNQLLGRFGLAIGENKKQSKKLL
jgi:hypothetical protein